SRELDEPITLRQKKYFSAYHQCIDPLTNKRLESRFDLAGSTCLHNDEVCAEGMCRILYSRSFSCGLGDVRWVDEDRDRSGGRHHAVHHFEAFFEQLGIQISNAGDVAAGMRQAPDEANSHWIGTDTKNDRD